MNSDGSDVTRLAPGEVPIWSPDGSRLTFYGEGGLWTVNADGSGLAAMGAGAVVGAWSPDGTRIAYQCPSAVHGTDICVADADGSGETNLTAGHPRPSNYYPDWSPDGTRIVYQTTEDAGRDLLRLGDERRRLRGRAGAGPGRRARVRRGPGPKWSPR